MRELQYWKDKYTRAESAYAAVKKRIAEYEAYCSGTRLVPKNPNSKRAVTKKAVSVRNLVHELIEAQIDSTIPPPKVLALRPQDVQLAQKCEHKLRNENHRLSMETVNDMAERFVYALGGCFYHIEWDNTKKTHTAVGDVAVSVLHPKQVVPQPGVYDIQKMDYLFINLSQTKEYILNEYGVDVSAETEEKPEIRMNTDTDAEQEDLVTQVICYFRNDDGGIGRISWVNDVLLEEHEDYQARCLKRCAKCGDRVLDAACKCGGKESVMQEEEKETLSAPVTVRDYAGNAVVLPEGTEIPYYKPNMYPIVVRRNISKYGCLLGASDIDVIEDQQNSIKKLETAIVEKLLSGGSVLTKLKKTEMKLDGEQLKIVEMNDVSEKSAIDVLTIQPDISADLAYTRELAEQAKGLLGVTDSFLGRQDTTATSGKAKQLSVQQSAGRLESKRVMKAAAYSDIYELVLKYLIAYSDEPRPVVHKDMEGHDAYSTFSRYDFLEIDAAGELYYNTDFLFSTDAAGDLAENRQAMWEETRMNFNEGAFGDVQDISTQILFWQFLEEQHYPNAGRMKEILEERRDKQLALEMQQAETEQALYDAAAIQQENEALTQDMEQMRTAQGMQQMADGDALLRELQALRAPKVQEKEGNAEGDMQPLSPSE